MLQSGAGCGSFAQLVGVSWAMALFLCPKSAKRRRSSRRRKRGKDAGCRMNHTNIIGENGKNCNSKDRTEKKKVCAEPGFNFIYEIAPSNSVQPKRSEAKSEKNKEKKKQEAKTGRSKNRKKQKAGKDPKRKQTVIQRVSKGQSGFEI